MDVRENYFDGFRERMETFFKSQTGKLVQYNEVRQRSVYSQPFYTTEVSNRIDKEARKFFMSSDTDYRKVKRIVEGLNRVMVPVSIIYC